MEPTLEKRSEGVSLAELRKRIRRSQAEVAGHMGTTQSGVSRIERQTDIKVSTLVDYVEALGGRLRVHAEFENDRFELSVPATDVLDGSDETRREYRVVWQDKESRGFVHVGWLAFTGDDFVYSYTNDARRNERFTPFPSLPDVDEVYRSSELFPFFALRLISTADPHYSQVLDWLGISRDHATPAELLARTPSESPHDTIQVVPEPTHLANGSLLRTFLVSGVRHAREASAERVDRVLSGLQAGEYLELIPEPDNPADGRALQLAARSVVIGWIPSYIVDEIHRFSESGRKLSFAVDQVNGPESPWHLRVLCRLTVSPQSADSS